MNVLRLAALSFLVFLFGLLISCSPRTAQQDDVILEKLRQIVEIRDKVLQREILLKEEGYTTESAILSSRMLLIESKISLAHELGDAKEERTLLIEKGKLLQQQLALINLDFELGKGDFQEQAIWDVQLLENAIRLRRLEK